MLKNLPRFARLWRKGCQALISEKSWKSCCIALICLHTRPQSNVRPNAANQRTSAALRASTGFSLEVTFCLAHLFVSDSKPQASHQSNDFLLYQILNIMLDQTTWIGVWRPICVLSLVRVLTFTGNHHSGALVERCGMISSLKFSSLLGCM